MNRVDNKENPKIRRVVMRGIRGRFESMPRTCRITLCGLAAVFVCALLLAVVPALRCEIIRLAEVHLVHRPLTAEVWHIRMIKLSVRVMSWCVIALIAMLYVLKENSEKAFYFAAMLLCFLCYYYGDIGIATRAGIDFWNALLDGQVFRWYSYEYNVVMQPMGWNAHMVFEFPLYLTFAIWNIPVFLFEKMTHMDYMQCVPAILYTKILPLLFFFGSIRVLKAICLEMGFDEDKSKQCVFFWMTSALVIEPVFVICQFDIFEVFLILIGYLEYLKGRRKRFVFWFAIAFCFKSFSLMVFLPLLVYREKRIVKILQKLALSLIPFVLCKLLFISDYNGPGQVFARKTFYEISKGIIESSMKLNFTFGGVKPSLFIIGWMIFLLYLFSRTEYNKKYVAPIATIAFGMFFAMSTYVPYRIVLISPFVALLTFQSENKKTSIIFEASMALSITVLFFCVCWWCYDANVISFTILRNTNKFSLDHFLRYGMFVKTTMLSVFIASIVLFVLYSCKRNMPDTKVLDRYGEKQIMKMRLGINLILCLAQIALPFAWF